MKTLTKIALFFQALSTGIHFYLSTHHYSLKLGAASGPSLCSVNSTFDCDSVSISAFSSFLGIPLSVWGLVANAFIFVILLLSWLQWTDYPERLKRAALLLTGSSVVASLIMGAISITLMKNYCLFCIALYVFSFISFFCIYKTLQEPFFKGIAEDIPTYFGESKGILLTFLMIPVLSFFTHKMFLTKYGAGELNTMVSRAVSSWKSTPAERIDTAPILAMGPSREEARFVLTEFADMLCHHCKNAASSVHAFATAHPDVRFEFYVFSLDGACNPAIPRSSGMSCHLSRTIYCANAQGMGWETQKAIFENQEKLSGSSSKDELAQKVSQLLAPLKMNSETLNACIESPESLEAIELQSKQGQVLNIQGTPSFYGNFKRLEMGQFIPVLEAASATSKSN